jgi:hypothetical protein
MTCNDFFLSKKKSCPKYLSYFFLSKKKSCPKYLSYFFLSKLETFAGRGSPDM